MAISESSEVVRSLPSYKGSADLKLAVGEGIVNSTVNLDNSQLQATINTQEISLISRALPISVLASKTQVSGKVGELFSFAQQAIAGNTIIAQPSLQADTQVKLALAHGVVDATAEEKENTSAWVRSDRIFCKSLAIHKSKKADFLPLFTLRLIVFGSR